MFDIKDLIYKKPVLSAICIDLFSLSLLILTIKYNLKALFVVILIILTVINGKILMNGIDMKKINKIVIIVSMSITIIVMIFYNYYTVLNRVINMI
ncbi:hypothetical protein JCM1393_11580 [Clostridium carnis]